ncbi:N-acetylneuraminate synthase [Psychrobacillus sp. FJAT-51614]|uniref:N-acetylneuraminate synthase n=1 Tax=Psychrobacillus mangrovi TaxID=3117745 RepID=A0ABU8F3L3_9BACI
MMNTYIIAEAGVNHNGSFELAKKLVLAAKEAGADAVKFQTFKAENLVTKAAEQAAYQVENLGEATSQFDMLKKLELSYDEFTALKQYCNEQSIEFLSTPFDFESVDFLVDTLGMEIVKIPSGELTNAPFIYYIATKRKKMIVSTGMATLDEIHEALGFIAFGLANFKKVSIEYVKAFYKTEKAKELLKQFVTVLHCTTEYPAPLETINLTAMNQLRVELQVPIGYSDHSEGIIVPITAIGLGATVIEKHFTLDKTLPGPDHRASLNPKELIHMIKGIRQVEQVLGSGLKHPSEIELKNRRAARKSIVAKTEIVVGTTLTEAHLDLKRPGTGLSPSTYWSLLGSVTQKAYEKDDLIEE